MQVSVENVGKLERKVTVRIPSDRYESRVSDRLRELGKTVRLKGFRPGKVPARVIEQRYGAQIRNEAMSDVIGSSFQEAVRQENLRPAVQPSIRTNPTDAGQIEYVATFEVVPEIGKVEVGTLPVSRATADVGDADIDRMIETLRLQRKAWTPVERGAENGDMVLFEYVASYDGKIYPESGKDRVGTVIGSGALPAELEQQLVGKKTAEDTRLEVTFPANYRVAALAGKAAKLDAHVVRVQEGKLPEIDDAFIASFGIDEGGLDKFRADVRANLERELHNALRSRLKNEVVTKLVEAYPDLDIPNAMVEMEARAMLREGQVRAERMGYEAPTAIEPFKDGARKRVTAFLLINEIARQQEIKLDQRRVLAELQSIASTYEEPAKVVELYSKDQELMNNLRARIIEEQVVEWIAEHAQVTDQPLTFAQVMNPNG